MQLKTGAIQGDALVVIEIAGFIENLYMYADLLAQTDRISESLQTLEECFTLFN